MAALVPEFLLRFLLCNHVSCVDARAIMALRPHPIRFVVDQGIFNLSLLGWRFKSVPASEAPGQAEQACAVIAVADGNLVCIFPGGKLARTGEVDAFDGGIAKIAAQTADRSAR